jgi:DNA polymerase-1
MSYHSRVFATLHPAYVLRNAGYMSSFVYDLIAMQQPTSDHWLDLEPMLGDQAIKALFGCDWISNQLLSFDVETDSLDAHSANLLCLTIASSASQSYLLTPEQVMSYQGALTELFKRNLSVAHNGKFDIEVLQRYGVRIKLAHDTMLMHYALDEQKGTHGLKSLASTYLGVPDYEARFIDPYFRTIERSDRNYAMIPRDKLFKYAGIDACVTYALAEKLLPLVKADGVMAAYNTSIDVSNALVVAETIGIKIDRPYLTELLKRVLDDIDKAKVQVKLDAKNYIANYIDHILLAPEGWRNPNPSWIKDRNHYVSVLLKCHSDLNLGSWQQVQVMLYDVIGLKHTKKLGYKTKPRSTNAEALESLLADPTKLDHSFVKTLQEYRKLDKMRSTYIEKLLHIADSNDRVHINFNIHGTETGRLSANDSLHGIPRPTEFYGKAIRGSFIASAKHKLVIADYSQAELRIFAALSKEPFLLEAYANGEDVHGNMCKDVFGYDQIVKLARFDKTSNEWYWLVDEYADTVQAQSRWKHLRTIAKNINFGGLVYLGGASGIAAMIPGGVVTEKQIAPLLKAAKAKMPTASAWQIDQYRAALAKGYVQSRFGNKRRFLLITDDNKEEIRKAAVNAPIQNSASQLNMIAGCELVAMGYKLVHTVHDSLIFDVPLDLVDAAKRDIGEVMTRTGANYFPEVPWKVDIEVNDRWYDHRPTLD